MMNAVSVFVRGERHRQQRSQTRGLIDQVLPNFILYPGSNPCLLPYVQFWNVLINLIRYHCSPSCCPCTILFSPSLHSWFFVSDAYFDLMLWKTIFLCFFIRILSCNIFRLSLHCVIAGGCYVLNCDIGWHLLAFHLCRVLRFLHPLLVLFSLSQCTCSVPGHLL